VTYLLYKKAKIEKVLNGRKNKVAKIETELNYYACFSEAKK